MMTPMTVSNNPRRNIVRYVYSRSSTRRSSPCARTSFVSSAFSCGRVRVRRVRTVKKKNAQTRFFGVRTIAQMSALLEVV